MSDSSKQIVAAALQLPEKERAAVVEELLDSLSEEAKDVAHEEWVNELLRRRAEFDDSPEGSLTWEELKNME